MRKGTLPAWLAGTYEIGGGRTADGRLVCRAEAGGRGFLHESRTLFVTKQRDEFAEFGLMVGLNNVLVSRLVMRLLTLAMHASQASL